MQQLSPRIITRPTASALQQAIQSFSDEAHEQRDSAIEDAITIIGEACAQLDEGMSPLTLLSWLTGCGLAPEYALSFVQQAEQIVCSSAQADARQDCRQPDCELMA